MALSKALRDSIPDVVRNLWRSELDQLLIEIAYACNDYAEDLEKAELYSELDQSLIELDINRLRSYSTALHHVVRNQGLGNEPVCEQTIIDEED